MTTGCSRTALEFKVYILALTLAAASLALVGWSKSGEPRAAVEAAPLPVVTVARALEAKLAKSRAEQAQARARVQQAQGDIASAEAKRTQSAQALDRIRQLRMSETATQASLDEALANDQTVGAAIQSAQAGLAVVQGQFQGAKANLGLARLNLADAKLQAPVRSIVSARQGQVESIAGVTENPVFKINRDERVEAEAEVIETDLGRMEQGDPVVLDIASVGKVSGSVRQIRPIVDPAMRIAGLRVTKAVHQSLGSTRGTGTPSPSGTTARPQSRRVTLGSWHACERGRR